MKTLYKFLLISGIIAVFLLILMETDWFVPKVKEPANIKEAKELIVKQVAETIIAKDTIYLNQSRLLGVCGNDDRFSAFSKLTEGFREIKNKLANPYIFEADYGYKDQYFLDHKTILMGESSWFKVFESDRMFKTPRIIPKEDILDIVVYDVKKDLIKVQINRNLNSKMVLQFDLIKDKADQWLVQNKIVNH